MGTSGVSRACQTSRDFRSKKITCLAEPYSRQGNALISSDIIRIAPPHHKFLTYSCKDEIVK